MGCAVGADSAGGAVLDSTPGHGDAGQAVRPDHGAVVCGAGEILLTSMDHDGTKNGFDNGLLKKINDSITIPLIASGGAGNQQHFVDVFQQANVDAALAASVFHYGEILIPELKNTLRSNGLVVR